MRPEDWCKKTAGYNIELTGMQPGIENDRS